MSKIEQGDVVCVLDGPKMIVAAIDSGLASCTWLNQHGEFCRVSVPLPALTFVRRFLLGGSESAAKALYNAAVIEAHWEMAMGNLLAGWGLIDGKRGDELPVFVRDGRQVPS